MARVPRQVARQVIPSGRVAGAVIPTSLSDVGQGIEAQGLAGLGRGIGDFSESVFQIGQKVKRLDDNQDVATGIAEYNNIINTFNETLPTLSPDDYMAKFAELEPDIQGITEGLSKEAASALDNKFVIWNEANRASTAALAIKQKASLAKEEIPTQLANFIANDQIQEANEYIEGYGDTVLSPEEIELWKDTIVEMKGNHDMWVDINQAVLTQTPDDIATAQESIRTFYRNDPQKAFTTLGSLNAKIGSKTRANNEARKAQVDAQAKEIGASAANSVAIEAVIAPEMEQAVTLLNQRIANGGGINQSDNVTFDALNEKILAGEFFTDTELTEAFAGTESGGMSAKEYQQLLPLNAENARLSIAQKETLATHAASIDEQFSQIRSLVNSKLAPVARPLARSVLTGDRLRLKREVKRMVLASEPPENIETAIDANFIGVSKRYIRGSWSRLFHWGVNDFTDAVLDETSNDVQNKIILDLLKDMRNTGDKPENLDDLIIRFGE